MGFFDFLKGLSKNGRPLTKEEETDRRMHLLREGAEDGNREDQYWLGVAHAYGINVDEDPEESKRWLVRSSEQGYVPAKHLLGALYLKSPDADTRRAGVLLLEQASEEDSDEAQYLLGICYVNGESVEQSYDRGLSLFRRAADSGNADAMHQLGRMHEHGIGVERDTAKALEFYSEAVRNGCAVAREDVDRLS